MLIYSLNKKRLGNEGRVYVHDGKGYKKRLVLDTYKGKYIGEFIKTRKYVVLNKKGLHIKR